MRNDPVFRKPGRGKVYAGLLVATVAAAVFVAEFEPRGTPDATAPAAPAGDGDARVAEAPASTPSRAERAPGGGSGTSTAGDSNASETLRQRLIDARSFVEVYEELIGQDPAALAPHELVFLAFIVESCHFAERVPDTAATQFATSTAPSPQDSARVAQAKERVRRRNLTAMCVGIPHRPDADDFIARLYAAAAAAGDPRARAWQLQRALEAAGTDLADTGLRTPGTPTPEQQAELLDILASRDPMAIALAGRLLTRGYSDFGVAIGPEGLTPSPALQESMWELLACEFGANCGPGRLQLDFACASAGRCNASSYYDYLQRYVLTPQDLHDFARMRPYLEAGLRTGDWSGVRFLGHNPGNYLGAGTRRFGLGG